MDINILLLQEMKQAVPLWFYPQQPNLLLSAWEKGRLYNEFYITIRIHHSSTQFPSQTSTRELSLFIKLGSKSIQKRRRIPTRSPDPKYMGVNFDQSNNSVVNSKIGYLQTVISNKISNVYFQ